MKGSALQSHDKKEHLPPQNVTWTYDSNDLYLNLYNLSLLGITLAHITGINH